MRSVGKGTLSLIVVSVAAFAVDAVWDYRLLLWGAKSHAIWSGQWHRLLAPNFIHADLMHLAFDMYALYLFGRIVEGMAGAARFFFVYFFSGAVGFLVSLWVAPDALSVGASAAIFGLMGYTIHHRLRRLPWRWLPSDTAFAQILGLNLVLGMIVPNIDQSAHLGGFIGGALAGSLVGLPRIPTVDAAARPAPWTERVAAALLALLVFGAGLNPIAFAERIEGSAPELAEQIEQAYGRFFAPFFIDRARLYVLDASQPGGSDWRPVARLVQRRAERPLALGLYWRWQRGARHAPQPSVYEVHWEVKTGEDRWQTVHTDRGSVSAPDPAVDRIYRRSLLAETDAPLIGGDWRLRAKVDGVEQFRFEFHIVDLDPRGPAI